MHRKLLNGKIIGVLVTILVLFMAVGVAEEGRTDASGQWQYILEDGGATITGCVVQPSGDLVIPAELDGYPVTSISEYAFTGDEYLSSTTVLDITSVKIPEGVIIIGEYAFDSCTGLTSVTIPKSVTTIGDSAFSNCFSLAGITIPAGVVIIDDYAFAGCSRLQSIEIPLSVTSIGMFAFAECSSLTEVSIPSSVKSIGYCAFDECPLLTLTVSKGSYATQYAEENGIPYVFATE